MPRARLSDGRVVESTDNLLGRFGGLVAGKTGHTALAGWSQVAFARVGGVGVTVSVLGSPSEAQRDRDLEALLRFGLGSYRMSRVVDPSRTYATVPVGWGEPPVRVVAPRAIVRPASTQRPLSEQIVVPAVVALPGQRGPAARNARRDETGPASWPAHRSSRTPAVPDPGVTRKAWWVTRRTVHHLVGLVP